MRGHGLADRARYHAVMTIRPGPSALIFLAIAGCGGSSKPAAGPGGGDADCEPGRCLEDISKVVEDHRPAARACYEAGHQVDPSLRGRIIVKFEIDAAGTVVDAGQTVQGDQITDEAVVACVVDVVKAITFAPSPRGKTTRAFHSYDFSPP